jgi:hypothetical protein
MGYSKNLQLIDKETPTGLLLFDSDSGRMLELNPTAKLLWQKTKDHFEMEDLRKIIEENCTSASNIDSDLVEFIKTALKHKMVTEDGKD